ncbi:MAG: hypothetical protein J0I14_04335 [Propionibacteriaceae bacterium]|jgi:hypothetical protein|nr:hypothetical protein [Propionibacteriaceae bacterium]
MSDTPKIEPGTTIHFLEPVLAFGVSFGRGNEVVLTKAMIESTRDSEGRSWLDNLTPDEQVRRWGEVRIGISRLPAGVEPWHEVGDGTWLDELARAREMAYAQPAGPLRDQALLDLHERFPDRPTTSTTLRRGTTL